jgi:small subunit ribosomal protein S19e
VASIARQVYLHPGTSVAELRNRYGSKKHYGSAPCHFCKCSGKVVRTILTQLEGIGWIKKDKTDGRIISAKGQKQLDLIAVEVRNSLQ